MTFQPVHAHSYARVRLSDIVSGQIRELISNGTLLPGQRLPAERDLAEQLNVSRPSLREALIRLESDGFIRAAGRGGFVVSDVTAPLVSHPLAALLEAQPNASADVLDGFAHVYREARYATHPVDERTRDQARAALRRLRGELTSLAGEAS